MLNSISWTEYLGFIVLLLIAYYVFVGLKFYSFELSAILKGKRSSFAVENITSEGDNIDDSKHFQNNEVELFPTYNRYALQPQEITVMAIVPGIRGGVRATAKLQLEEKYRNLENDEEVEIVKDTKLTGTIWKLGCNWGTGRPSFLTLM